MGYARFAIFAATVIANISLANPALAKVYKWKETLPITEYANKEIILSTSFYALSRKVYFGGTQNRINSQLHTIEEIVQYIKLNCLVHDCRVTNVPFASQYPERSDDNCILLELILAPSEYDSDVFGVLLNRIEQENIDLFNSSRIKCDRNDYLIQPLTSE